MVSLGQFVEQICATAGMGSRKKMDWEQEKKTFQRIFSNKTECEQDRGIIRRQIRTKSSARITGDYRWYCGRCCHCPGGDVCRSHLRGVYKSCPLACSRGGERKRATSLDLLGRNNNWRSPRGPCLLRVSRKGLLRRLDFQCRCEK
jgi:hypothetical protein